MIPTRNIFNSMPGDVPTSYFSSLYGRPSLITRSGGGAPRTINSLATYDLDFAANTYKGDPFFTTANNNADGRTYRQYLNFAPTNSKFRPSSAGVYSGCITSCLQRTDMGLWIERDRTNYCLQNRDLSNASWTKTNVTATRNQTGITGTANTGSSITATSAGGTVTQAITKSSGDVIGSVSVKRLVGTGTLEMTIDGGATWTDLTSQITANYARLSVPYQTLTNPTIGFRIGTSGDSFAVDFVQLEQEQFISEPILTSTASVQSWGDRAACYVADSSNLGELFQGAFGFYIESASRKPTTFSLLTPDAAGGPECYINTDGSVRFGVITTPGTQATTAAGVYTRGINTVNKVAGYITTAGAVRLCVNGGTVATGSQSIGAPLLGHVDLACNGAGANTIHGRLPRVAYFSADVLTEADLVTFTT